MDSSFHLTVVFFGDRKEIFMLVWQRFASSPLFRLSFHSGDDFLCCTESFNCNVTYLSVLEMFLCHPAFSLGVCPEMELPEIHIIILSFEEPVYWVI